MGSHAQSWPFGSAALTFPTERIDVWRVPLEAPGRPQTDLFELLSADEAARASRFHFDKHRARYIRGRAALRILLGRYLDVPAREIRFQYENNGKPELAFPVNMRNLYFNSSDSDVLGLIAVGCCQNIGVDLEKVRPMPDLLNIAKRFFSAREVQAILAISEEKREEAFFACWTRKEAFLKATGVGLKYPLSKFSVSVDPAGVAALCEIDGNTDIAAAWFMMDIFPEEGFRGVVACEGHGFSVSTWSFQ